MTAGCMVGPDYQAPKAPAVQTYTPAPLARETLSAPVQGGAQQRFEPGEDIPAQWWSLFRAPDLDRLIRQALAGNPTLAAAQATLRQAQENRRALYGSLLPQAHASVYAARQQVSGRARTPELMPPPYTLYNATVNISYTLDLFGGIRRQLEAADSQINFRKFQLEAAYLTIASNVVTATINDASLRAQIRETLKILSTQQKQLALVEGQSRLGGASYSDVLAQRAVVAQTRTTLPPLEKQLAQNQHLLAVLTGKFPGETTLPEFDLEGLILPRDLPVSLPSSLVRQRPDIASSEALLHAASAMVGVATADLYPQITLSGQFGWQSATLSDMFTTSGAVWSLGAGFLQPLFHGGALSARRQAAVAAFDESAALYRQTVLKAFQDVADVLRALEMDAAALAAQAEAEAAARTSFELTEKQFRLGAVSYLSLLNAERQFQEARIGLIKARAARLADTAALFQALGGGWWNRSGTNPAASIKRSNG